MTRSLSVCLLLVVASACKHADTVGSEEPNPRNVPTKLPPPKAVTPKTEPGHPGLAATPTQLYQPGTGEEVAEKLRTLGFLAPDAKGTKALEAGVRKFQESQGLAATGFTDHETLKRLGIDPKVVDKSAKPETGTQKEPPGKPPEEAKQR